MRIAFDLDNTLIPAREKFPVEVSILTPLLRLWFREPWRVGTRRLMRTLRAEGCELWIYTSSGRDAMQLRVWFLLHGVYLGGVVNCRAHERLMRNGGHPSCSKYPPAFGIDLLIDDAEGVALEGQQHGFEVLVISPFDTEWTNKVLDAVHERRRIIRT